MNARKTGILFLIYNPPPYLKILKTQPNLS